MSLSMFIVNESHFGQKMIWTCVYKWG